MANESYFDNVDCRRAAQYLVTMIAVLLVGYLLSILPVMTRLEFAGVFLAADIVLFISRLAALILLYLFARHAAAVIPDQGGTLSFIRHIIEPVTILFIVVLNQGLFWQGIKPFVGDVGRAIYFGTVITLIVAVSIWLILRAYQQAQNLVDAVQYLGAHFPKLMPAKFKQCSACRGSLPHNAKFCSHCGHKVEDAVKCHSCGQTLRPGQRFCQQCGKAVVKIVPRDSER